MVIIFDSQQNEVENISKLEELKGSLGTTKEEALMHTVLESKESSDDGKLIFESTNYGINNFTPEIIFKNVVNNYQMAKNLYGETILRQLSGR